LNSPLQQPPLPSTITTLPLRFQRLLLGPYLNHSRVRCLPPLLGVSHPAVLPTTPTLTPLLRPPFAYATSGAPPRRGGYATLLPSRSLLPPMGTPTALPSPSSKRRCRSSTTRQQNRTNGTCRAPAAGVGHARSTRLKHGSRCHFNIPAAKPGGYLVNARPISTCKCS
jgi:hypothetical protein